MPYENHVLENVFGTIGTVLWCVQIVPQVIVNYRRKDVEGLSTYLMATWSIASIFLGVYCVAQNLNIPLIVQPQLFGALAALTWAQCLYYGPTKLSKLRTTVFLITYLALFGGLEAGLVFATRAGTDHGTDAPVLLFGILCAVLLLGGLGPQYYEIWKFKEVVGLSLVFMTMDMLGGVFCTLSLVFKKDFDALAAVNYIGIVVLDGGILILAAVLNPRANRRRRRLAALHLAEKGSSSPDTGGSVAPVAAEEDEEDEKVAEGAAEALRAHKEQVSVAARMWDVEEAVGVRSAEAQAELPSKKLEDGYSVPAGRES